MKIHENQVKIHGKTMEKPWKMKETAGKRGVLEVPLPAHAAPAAAAAAQQGPRGEPELRGAPER